MSKSDKIIHNASIEDLMDILDEKDPWYEEVWHWIKYRPIGFYRDVKFEVKNWLQRAFWGYTTYDCWNYYGNTSARAVKCLTWLRDKGHGAKALWAAIQSMDGDRTDWIKVLDSAIFFHTVCAGLERPKDKQFESSYKTRKGVHTYTVTHYDLMNLTPDELEKYKVGKWEYLQNYEKMWD